MTLQSPDVVEAMNRQGRRIHIQQIPLRIEDHKAFGHLIENRLHDRQALPGAMPRAVKRFGKRRNGVGWGGEMAGAGRFHWVAESADPWPATNNRGAPIGSEGWIDCTPLCLFLSVQSLGGITYC